MLPQDLLDRWHLSQPRLVAETARGTVWKVIRAGSEPAALKVLGPAEIEEARGAIYLQTLDGQGAVRVLAREGDAILMEWCDGPSLGDLVRAGRDNEATMVLCDVIRTLPVAPADPRTLEPLAIRFAPLVTPHLTGDLAAAAHLARDLLASTTQTAALHGDLHHDNILHSPRGWLAIDPKGVVGDPAYEVANAFRNPDGAGDLVFRPDRISHLVHRFSQRLNFAPSRMLGWAAAHSALSTFWSRDAGQDITVDLRLLPLLLVAARR